MSEIVTASLDLLTDYLCDDEVGEGWPRWPTDPLRSEEVRSGKEAIANGLLTYAQLCELAALSPSVEPGSEGGEGMSDTYCRFCFQSGGCAHDCHFSGGPDKSSRLQEDEYSQLWADFEKLKSNPTAANFHVFGGLLSLLIVEIRALKAGGQPSCLREGEA